MTISNIGNSTNRYYSTTNSDNIKKEELQKTQASQESKSDKIKSSDYLKSLQDKVPTLNLEIGYGLSGKKDNKYSVSINPKIISKMQSSPEDEEKYTQTLKSIERAEKMCSAYYNSLGGNVERTSHWYIDENGEVSSFSITRVDDKMNKKLRDKAKKKAEEQIEKIREKNRKNSEQISEKLEKKRTDKSKNKPYSAKITAEEKYSEMVLEKLKKSDGNELFFDEKDMKPILQALNDEEDNLLTNVVGKNLDVKI